MHFAAHMQADSAAETQEVSFSSSLASQQNSMQTTPREGTSTGCQPQQQQQQQQGGVAERAAAAAGGASSQLLQRIESRGFSGLWRRSPSMEVRREQVGWLCLVGRILRHQQCGGGAGLIGSCVLLRGLRGLWRRSPSMGVRQQQVK
jgi:hypothetical protein